SGAFMNVLGSGNFDGALSGFAAGMVSSLVSSSIEGLAVTDGTANSFGRNTNLFKATMIASGGLSGGISSSIAGGNFWDGARQGIITSGLNHLGNHLKKWLYQEMTLNRRQQKYKYDCVPTSARTAADYLGCSIEGDDYDKVVKYAKGKGGILNNLIPFMVEKLGLDIEAFNGDNFYFKDGIPKDSKGAAIKFIVESLSKGHPVMIAFRTSDMPPGSGHVALIKSIEFLEDFSSFRNIELTDPEVNRRVINTFNNSSKEVVRALFSISNWSDIIIK